MITIAILTAAFGMAIAHEPEEIWSDSNVPAIAQDDSQYLLFQRSFFVYQSRTRVWTPRFESARSTTNSVLSPWDIYNQLKPVLAQYQMSARAILAYQQAVIHRNIGSHGHRLFANLGLGFISIGDFRASVGVVRTSSGIIPVIGFGATGFADDDVPNIKLHLSLGVESSQSSEFEVVSHDPDEQQNSGYFALGMSSSKVNNGVRKLKAVALGAGLGYSNSRGRGSRWQVDIPVAFIPWPGTLRSQLNAVAKAERKFLLSLSTFDLLGAHQALTRMELALEKLRRSYSKISNGGSVESVESLPALHPGGSLVRMVAYGQELRERSLLSRCQNWLK